MKELTQSFLTKEKLNQDMENPEKRLGNIDSFLPDSFKKRKGGQRMWRDTIIEEDNRIVATGDNVRMNTREIADLFNITAASVNRAVKRVLKSDVLNDYEVVKLVRLDNGLLLEFYSLEPIIVLSYKWNTFYTFAIGIRESSQLTRSTRLRQSLMHNTATYHFGLIRYGLPTASPSLRVAKGNALPIPDKNNTSPDFAGAYE